MYGIPLGTKSSDELLSHVFEAMDDVARFTGSKNRYMVEMFPSMLLLPDWLAKWKREAVAASKRYSAIFEGLYESARLQMVFALKLSGSPGSLIGRPLFSIKPAKE